MKTSLIIITALSTGLLSCQRYLAPEKVPSLVNNSLEVRFPGATSVTWEKTKNQFEAEFEIAGLEITALFDADGNLVRHKGDVKEATLPAPVQLALTKMAPGFIIDDLEKLDSQGQVYYQIELQNKQKELKLVYTADGKIAHTVPYWD